jgi:2-dehydro-3-deoxyphosphogluconate aldolase / (4S)-4-hydroxy-2-oxoglutarate aldolase
VCRTCRRLTRKNLWRIVSGKPALEQIADARVVAVVRSNSGDEAVQRAAALIGGGVDVVEVAFTTPDAAQAITAIVQEHPNALVGAGTVLDEATARIAILAGARFLLSPTLSSAVINTARRYGTAAIPGVQTPTEMLLAREAGADAVKLFPAGTLGPGYLKAVLAALPELSVIPTGGVAIDGITAWLDAGAVAVGVGGALTSGSLDETAARAAEVAERLATWKAGRS